MSSITFANMDILFEFKPPVDYMELYHYGSNGIKHWASQVWGGRKSETAIALVILLGLQYT